MKAFIALTAMMTAIVFFVIALALQASADSSVEPTGLTYLITDSHDKDWQVRQVHLVITEDDPRWDCRTMGNQMCGSSIGVVRYFGPGINPAV